MTIHNAARNSSSSLRPDYAATTAFRALDNPPARLPLPATLTETIGFNDPDILLEKLKKPLRAHGVRLDDLERLNIAYPHKHPSEEGNDKAVGEARMLRGALKKACPGVAFPLAAAIHETVHLGRSEDQSVLHALTGKQIYAVDPSLQSEPLPFIERDHNRPECFVIVDWTMSQGTTIANLASYLTHNGGHVVAAIVPDYGGEPIAQRSSCDRGELRRIFHHAACDLSGNYGPEECVVLFDAALKNHGRSLATLTHNEFKRLQNTVDWDSKMFFNILNDLGMDAAARREFLHNRRAGRQP